MAKHQPGRRVGGRRRLDASVPADYDVPTRGPRIASPELAQLVMSGVFFVWFVALLGAGTALVDVGAPAQLARPCAAVLMVVFVVGLVHRGGGHMRLWAVPVAGLGLVAVATQYHALLTASAVVTAVSAGVWSVLMTRPADHVAAVVREYLIALVAAFSGTVAVAAWNADVSYQRFNLIVVAAALAIAMALVWSLGAGLHGLGRENLLILVGGAAVLVLVIAYSSFVRAHGSQALVDTVTDLVIWIRETFRGVPRPIEVLLGFPALVVGVSLRARRREGWWALVFAVVGTSVMTTSLVSPGAFPTYIGLSTLYSVVLGLLVGLVVRSQLVTERRSRRAARTFEQLSRVEPGRFAPLR